MAVHSGKNKQLCACWHCISLELATVVLLYSGLRYYCSVWAFLCPCFWCCKLPPAAAWHNIFKFVNAYWKRLPCFQACWYPYWDTGDVLLNVKNVFGRSSSLFLYWPLQFCFILSVWKAESGFCVCSYTAAIESKWYFSACWGHLQEGGEVLLLETRKAVPVG